MRQTPYYYLHCCLDSDGQSIQALKDSAREVSLATLRRHIHPADLHTFETRLGYDTGQERGGLRLKDSPGVDFLKSVYRGQPCYVIRHSRIEYIFVRL